MYSAGVYGGWLVALTARSPTFGTDGHGTFFNCAAAAAAVTALSLQRVPKCRRFVTRAKQETRKKKTTASSTFSSPPLPEVIDVTMGKENNNQAINNEV